MRETARLYVFFFVISSRPKRKERISFPSVPQDRHSIPMWKPVNGWGEREPAICFHASSCLLPWVREREASTLLTPVAAYHPHATFTSDSSAKGFVRCFFLGNCRQSYNLNKEYLGKNRKIFGFFQTGWEGLPPDSHFHCFLCFLNWHGQIQEDFYPFFSGDRLKSSAWYSIEGESTRTNFKWTSRLFLQSKIISPTSQIQWFPQYYPR